MRALSENEVVHLALMTPGEGTNWAERHGWWMLSVCAHLLLLIWFVAAREPMRFPVAQARRFVVLPAERAIPAASAAQSAARAEFLPEEDLPRPLSSPSYSEAAFAVTRQTFQDLKESLQRKLEVPVDLEPSPSLESEFQEAEQDRRIADLLEKYNEAARNSARSAAQDQMKIDLRLRKAEVLKANEEASGDLEGLSKGTVRTVNFGNVASQVEQEVMRRYGIRRERRLVTPGGSSYLNSISVGGVEYGVPREAGINEVIALPERALSKMIALEQMWLVARNYDPRTTQVKRVEFGVVQQSEGKWDLGIVDIEVQDLRGILGGDRQ